MLAERIAESWVPTSETEKAAVQQQLEQLLATPFFNCSKRYPSFLKYVVTCSLAGQTDQLKERLLGVEIFGRPPDYDTNTDAIVRVTAAEIRKRIELYYKDPKHAQEIRLLLPSGSYAPQFTLPGPLPTILPRPPGSPAVVPAGIPAESETSRKWSLLRINSPTLGLAIIAAALLLGAVWYIVQPSPLKQFWGPFTKSGEPVLFCIADQSQYSSIRLRDAGNPGHENNLKDHLTTVVIDDISPLVNIAGMLRTYGKSFRVLGASTTTLTDLRRGPSVFIGAFDNVWTLRLTSPLRFHFANDTDMQHFWIEDRTNPEKRAWILNRSEQQETDTYKDYAIVARLVDPDTDQFVVVAAGIGRGGTVGAGEFLVDPNVMLEVLKNAPSHWNQKNVEIVLETQVVQGRSGPPRMVAVHIW